MSQPGSICDGRESYSLFSIIYENVVIVAHIGLGTALMSSWRVFDLPVLGLAFLLFCLVMLGFVLRRQLCSRCYYYGKWCHCGWGKLSTLVVLKAAQPIPVTSKLAPLFWILVMFLPLAAVGGGLALSETTFRTELPYLAGFVITTVLAGEMHVRDCKFCKMRRSCPGSAARG